MRAIRKHIIIGTVTGVLLVSLYLGIIALAQDWRHAVEQTVKLWYWILLLAMGFGVQVGLFSFIRQAVKERKAAAASVAASGGVSAGSMIACYAHHQVSLPAVWKRTQRPVSPPPHCRHPQPLAEQ